MRCVRHAVLSILLITTSTLRAAPITRGSLPYRTLLVISNQWTDPASEIIEGDSDFAVLAAALTSWAIPFEILRLDQQRFDAAQILERDGRPRFGAILWDAEPADTDEPAVARLRSLVEQDGVGLLVFGDAVASEPMARLCGVRHLGPYSAPFAPEIDSGHFLTRPFAKRPEWFAGRTLGRRVRADLARSLATRGGSPFLSVREEKGARVVWLDVDRAGRTLEPAWARALLKRSLVWLQGSALYAEYPRSVLIEMHDMGTSDKTYLSYWHYRTLSEETIRTRIIEPLARRGAVVTQLVNTGFVDRWSQRVIDPWRQEHVTDSLDGTVHDYASTKRGLDAGQRAGVFDIESHGWTHMLPDLDSPPGPFWTGALDGIVTLDWYNEFYDGLRQREVPAATQRFHLQRAIECIQEDFGIAPVFFHPGGAGFSRSFVNHTARLAAQLGFGLVRLEAPYALVSHRVVSLEPVAPHQGWSSDQTLRVEDVPWSDDGPVFLSLHDRDVARDGGSVERLLRSLGDGVRFMSAAEYCAYLHARVSRAAAADGTLRFGVDYDPQYCRFLSSHGSAWTLHVDDEHATAWGVPERRVVDLPQGVGPHTVTVEAARR